MTALDRDRRLNSRHLLKRLILKRLIFEHDGCGQNIFRVSVWGEATSLVRQGRSAGLVSTDCDQRPPYLHPTTFLFHCKFLPLLFDYYYEDYNEYRAAYLVASRCLLQDFLDTFEQWLTYN